MKGLTSHVPLQCSPEPDCSPTIPLFSRDMMTFMSIQIIIIEGDKYWSQTIFFFLQ